MSKRTEWDTKGDSDESNNLLIYQHKAKLQQAVKDNSFLVVTGETGSGKTTQLPQYLHQAGTFVPWDLCLQNIKLTRKLYTLYYSLRV